MALRSMTGFGSAEAATPAGVYRVEVRSVNNRYLDVQTRLPKAMMALEQRVKQAVGEQLSRGSINLNVTCARGESETRLTWDREAVGNYVRILREVAATHKIKSEVTLSDLLHFSDFIKTETVDVSEDALWGHVLPVLNAALKSFQRSREQEGRFLERELRRMLKEVAAVLKRVEARSPQRLKAYQTELSRRVGQLLEKRELDESRLAMEVALMAERLDISEECTRLRAHIEQFTKAIASGEPVGKHVNFLMQEMNREANTICSKSNDAPIAQMGIALKELIEKIREQIQNIE
jgi:uncharacterized protein (TIGR00255 family)